MIITIIAVAVSLAWAALMLGLLLAGAEAAFGFLIGKEKPE